MEACIRGSFLSPGRRRVRILALPVTSRPHFSEVTMRAMRVGSTLALVAVMLLAGVGVAYAQTGTAGLRGKVTDEGYH